MLACPRRRSTVGAVFLTGLLAACVGGGEPAAKPPPPASTIGPSAGTTECVALERGFRVRFPSTWFVNDADKTEPCRFFHPEPFSLDPGTEATGIAVNVRFNPMPFDQVTPWPEGSPASEVLDGSTTTVDGRRAARLETRATGRALLPEGVRGVSWFVDVADGTLVAATSEAAAAGSYVGNVEVLDQMMRSLRILERESACSAGRSVAVPAPQPALPDPVGVLRGKIVDAAKKCDYEALARLALAGDDRFTYSFGESGQPGAFWKAAESGGRPLLRSLVEILDGPFATRTVEGTTQYLWPSAYAFERWEDVPPREREALRRSYGDEDLRRFERFGSYTGHRVGITASGDWIFFVAGD